MTVIYLSFVFYYFFIFLCCRAFNLLGEAVAAPNAWMVSNTNTALYGTAGEASVEFLLKNIFENLNIHSFEYSFEISNF